MTFQLSINRIKVIFLLLFLTSCLSYQQSSSKLQSLKTSISPQFSGSFHQTITEQGFLNLPEFVQLRYQHNNGFFHAGDEVTAKIKLLDETKLEFIVFKNDSLLSVDTLAGQVKRNYFFIEKQRYKDLSEGQVFHNLCKSKTRIALSENNNLVIDNVSQFMIRLFYIPIVIEDEHWKDLVFYRVNS